MNKISLEEIEKQLINCIAPIISLDSSEVDSGTSLAQLGITSLALVEIFIFIEKEFNLRLLNSGFKKEDISTIKSLSFYISERL